MAAADEQLRRRLRAAVAQAGALLGRPEPAPGQAAAELPGLIAALREADGEGEAGAEQAAHEEQLRRLSERYERRSEMLSRVDAAIGQLREVTSPPAMLAAAPQRLCEASELDRVLLSTVEEGAMVAEAAYFRDDPDAAAAALEALKGVSIRLEHPLVEAEVLRRRRATVVPDAQLHPRVDRELNRVMGWETYVVTPVSVRSRVIAVIHAERRSGPLDVIHREVLWRFAVGLGQAYESAALRRTLRQERELMRRFLDRLNARLAELSDGAIRFAPARLPAAAAEPVPEVRQREAVDDGAIFDGLLTRRETEVLRLLAEGLTNRAIADRLVVSEGTIKFHVNSILRKLRASNRAEAVSRYLTRRG